MTLPDKFLENMKEMLAKDEFKAFLSSYDKERVSGIRANTLRVSAEEFRDVAGEYVELKDGIPWCLEGFYYENSQPGQLPLYHAGVYYIQEPSAMYPGGNVPLKEGDYVLDLCAAPGGKSTQLAARLSGTGLIVSNDISEERTKALVKNIQMAGIVNSVVTNETPENLADRFPEFFDVIVVDAPCSGEGMFRKDAEAVSQWESYKAERCRGMQDGILESADKMLKKGGILSYSTCTFNPLENEESLLSFMSKHSEYRLIDTPKVGNVSGGLDKYKGFEKAARLWPHKVDGEGHFTAFLKKGDEEVSENACENENISYKKRIKDQKKSKTYQQSYRQLNDTPIEVREFYDYYMKCEPPKGHYFTMGTNLYYLPVRPLPIDGLKVPMAGVHMGSIEHGDFKPSHRLALTMRPSDFCYYAVFDPDSDAITRYLKGETITLGEECEFFADGNKVPFDVIVRENVRGICAVCIKAGGKSFVLGLGSLNGGNIKNLYPKGWRRFN